MKLCVIGQPVSHSRSPALHTELLAKAHLPGTYTAVEVAPAQLADFVAAAKQGAYDGFNVTMPHKETVIPLLDALGEDVQCGAVNTVVIRQGRAVGHNTDGAGFLRSLPISVKGRKCLILGAGGAAKAICASLVCAGAQVWVCSRKKTPLPGAKPMAWDTMDAGGCSLLVNATPLGMRGQGEFASFAFLDRLLPHAVVYDLVYEPEDTALLQAAKARGLTAVGGMALLKAQAELAFTYFTT